MVLQDLGPRSRQGHASVASAGDEPHVCAKRAHGLIRVLVAVGLTMAASSLSSQSIGISAEPTTAGNQLAVPERTTPTARTKGNRAQRNLASAYAVGGSNSSGAANGR